MKTERVVGTVLLAMAIVFGVSLAVMPLGDAWAESSETRTTEIYGMFTKVRQTTPAGEAADGTGATWYYIDSGLDATGGIDYLRAMGLVLAAAMLLAVVALFLTSLPRVNQTRAGAIFALPATLLFIAAAGMAYVGTQMHAEHLVASDAEVILSWPAAAVGLLGALSLLIATALGLTGARKQQPTAVPDGQWLAGRRLRCPDCSTVVATGYGVVPICPNCEFGADYDGPAGKPVAAQPVNS